MIPTLKFFFRPMLELAAEGPMSVAQACDRLAVSFDLPEEDLRELLPSGKQTRFANRVSWARSYLKQAGLVENPERGYFTITARGRALLENFDGIITNETLLQYEEFREFKLGQKIGETGPVMPAPDAFQDDLTPDEIIRKAHADINAALRLDLIERLRESSPAFFEDVIVRLMLAMGYGHDARSGRVMGQSGDDGVDGVINLDPLGVDQVYVQAKRYGEGNSVGSGQIRDFFGALAMKDVQKGVFMTTSVFSPSARTTAGKLSARIVLIDGPQLASLMIAHQVGCRITDHYPVSTIDESFFE